MKRCFFQSLLLASPKERTGRRINFHPRVTIVRGPNDTGKSSVLKTLAHTFSPVPEKLHPRWKAAGVRSLVHFTVDDVPYSILKSGARFSVFDGVGNILISTTSVTSQLSPFLGELFGFRLRLTSRSGDSIQATPAFLMLPFYIDQDAGWSKNWSSFSGLGQFTKWRLDVAEYHTGIRPSIYYDLKGELGAIRTKIREASGRQEVIQSVRADLRQSLTSTDFNLDYDAFKNEIQLLLVRCDALKEKEAQLKADMLRWFNAAVSVRDQMAIVNASERELTCDYRYAIHEVPEDSVRCPTCGTIHKNSITERFSIAKDIYRCVELKEELLDEYEDCQRHLQRIRSTRVQANREIADIESMLSQQIGDMVFEDVLRAEGKREAQAAFEREVQRIRDTLIELERDESELMRRMETYDREDRRERIRKIYEDLMTKYLRELEVSNLPVEKYRRLDSSIPESGSDLTRALLAYYYSIANVIASNDAGTMLPLIIDSPRQQDQDPANWQRMLEFMRDNLPAQTQLILALVDHQEVDFGGSIEELDVKNNVLLPEEYQNVMDAISPYLNASAGTGGLFQDI